MKKVIKWILLVWSVLAIPYAFMAEDFVEGFFSLLFVALIIGVLIDDLKKEK